MNYDRPSNYFADYAGNVRALSEADLADAAKAFIRSDEIVWLVVGDLRKIEDGVRSLGLGEIVRLDAGRRVSTEEGQ